MSFAAGVPQRKEMGKELLDMKKTAGWRLACLLAAAVAALAWGCGRQGVTGEGLPVGKEPGAGEGETAMGRYVEEEADL